MSTIIICNYNIIVFRFVKITVDRILDLNGNYNEIMFILSLSYEHTSEIFVNICELHSTYICQICTSMLINYVLFICCCLVDILLHRVTYIADRNPQSKLISSQIIVRIVLLLLLLLLFILCCLD